MFCQAAPFYFSVKREFLLAEVDCEGCSKVSTFPILILTQLAKEEGEALWSGNMLEMENLEEPYEKKSVYFLFYFFYRNY